MRYRTTLFSLLVPAMLWLSSTTVQAQTFRCSSNNGQYQTCPIPRNGPVQMVRQLSQAACVQGRTWGTRGNQVWVDKGCRAEFQVGGPGYGGPGYNHPPNAGYPGGPNHGPGWDRPPAYYSGSFSGGRSNCTSGQGSGRVYCQSGGTFKYANPVRVNGQCVQNRTWGVSQYGLWVANGCSGQWEIKR